MVKKRNILVVLICVLVIALSGCGRETTTNVPSVQIPEEKTVTDKDITIIFVENDEEYYIDGKYTGDVKGGEPNGFGLFTASGNDGLDIKYEGSFVDARFDGHGSLTLKNAEQEFVLRGTWSNSKFTPTAAESFDYLSQIDIFGKYSLPDSVFEFIESHNELYPVCEKATAEATDLKNFSYKQFTKTRKQEEVGLVKLKLTAQQVFEDEVADIDSTVTSMLARDSDYNYYVVYHLGSIEVYDGDSFITYAIPCATSYFDNVGGGQTNVIVLLSCFTE